MSISVVGTLNIGQICERKSDILISPKDIGMIERNARNNAIEEFVEVINNKIGEFVLQHKNNLDFASGISVAWNIVDSVAEQMKAVNGNG